MSLQIYSKPRVILSRFLLKVAGLNPSLALKGILHMAKISEDGAVKDLKR